MGHSKKTRFSPSQSYGLYHSRPEEMMRLSAKYSGFDTAETYSPQRVDWQIVTLGNLWEEGWFVNIASCDIVNSRIQWLWRGGIVKYNMDFLELWLCDFWNCTAGRRLVSDPSRINIHLSVMSDSSIWPISPRGRDNRRTHFINWWTAHAHRVSRGPIYQLRSHNTEFP